MKVYVVAYPPHANSTIMHIRTEIYVLAEHPILQGQKNAKTFESKVQIWMSESCATKSI